MRTLWGLCIGLEIVILSGGCLQWIVRTLPDHRLRTSRKAVAGLVLAGFAEGLYISCFLEHWGRYGQFLLGIYGAYLLVASIQDAQSCEVYDFLHAPAAVLGMVLLGIGGEAAATEISVRCLGLLAFVALQFGVFIKMYGTADVFVFLVCAIYQARFGRGLLTHLLHMGLAYTVLAIVQLLRRNVGRDGNLKVPVPFVPYIAVTAWLFL